ncbi:MAG: hypothetical protein MMC33_002265 [Icmadophila ericetorum]|nr:hypothetical protein [Icmadophila ericetorum]
MDDSNDLKPSTAQHDAIVDCIGRLVVPPVDLTKPGTRVLDSGTGDVFKAIAIQAQSRAVALIEVADNRIGQWLIDLAASLPGGHDVKLVGTDISPAKFPQTPEPFKIGFTTQSIKEPWPSKWHNSFDLVHQRLVLGACGSFSHKQAVKNLIELVKPGGWIQMIECDQVCGINDGPAMHEFIDLVSWVFVSVMGGTISYAGHLKEWMEELGLTDVQDRGVPLLLGAANPKKELAARTALSTALAMEPLIAYANSKIYVSWLCE